MTSRRSMQLVDVDDARALAPEAELEAQPVDADRDRGHADVAPPLEVAVPDAQLEERPGGRAAHEAQHRHRRSDEAGVGRARSAEQECAPLPEAEHRDLAA